MKILIKPLKIAASLAILFAGAAASPAWAQIDLAPKSSISISIVNTERFSNFHQQTVTFNEIVNTQGYSQWSSQVSNKPFLPAKQQESANNNTAKVIKKNNIFELATIFNDKLQQFLASFTRVLFSALKPETNKNSLSAIKSNPNNNCQLTFK